MYDRAQLIELPLDRKDVGAHLDGFPYRDLLLATWDALRPVAPFGFRVLDEIHAYVTAAIEEGIPWEQALDEQLIQKVLPRVRGADARVGQALDDLLKVFEEKLPLSRAKTSDMLDGYSRHGFTSFF